MVDLKTLLDSNVFMVITMSTYSLCLSTTIFVLPKGSLASVPKCVDDIILQVRKFQLKELLTVQVNILTL